MAGLQEKIRSHILLAKTLEREINRHPDFELLAPRTFNLLCFRYRPRVEESEDQLNKINERLLHELNDSGKLYLSHTRLNGKFTLRMVIGQTNVDKKHVAEAWQNIKRTAENIKMSC